MERASRGPWADLSVLSTREYRAGKREGPAVRIDANGDLHAEGTYVAGALHGPYVEYAPDGTVKGTESWDRGRRVVQAEPSESETTVREGMAESRETR